MKFKVFDLGLADFQKANQFQKEIFIEVRAGDVDSALIICQHYPVITKGRSSHKENILVSEEELKDKGISVYEIERGGDVTYHGPGQLCIYPIVNLNYFKKDVGWFLRSLEGVALNILSDFKIKAERLLGLTGLWVGRGKIVSLGIAIRNWITCHGMSLNIKKDDLANFSLIRPCGMDIIMTSMETVLGEVVKIDQVKKIAIRRWYETSNFARIG